MAFLEYVLPALGSMVTSVFTNKQNNKANLQLAREQNAWNEMMWNKSNEYNAPSNQMRLLKDAGINPNAMLEGHYTPTQASELQSADLANQQENTGLSQSMMQLASMMMQKPQMDVAEQQARSLEIDNDIKEQTRDEAIRRAGLENKNIETDMEVKREQIKVAKQQVKNLQQQGKLTKAQRKEIEAALPYIAKLKEAELRQIDKVIENLESEIQLHKIEGSIKGQEYYVAKFRAELAKKGINPDTHGFEALLDVLLKDPEKGVQQIKDIIDTFKGESSSIMDDIGSSENIEVLKKKFKGLSGLDEETIKQLLLSPDMAQLAPILLGASKGWKNIKKYGRKAIKIHKK